MLLLMAAIKLDSKGPVFYRAQRIGRKGRTFTCYKFRTMCADADKLKDDLKHRNERDGILFKIANDPRVTRVGRFLRKYSLDELPQFYNVLRGDMSLVGPRPPMASEVEQYDLAHLRRLDVLPGMTGLWQVEARQDPSFDSYISLDTAYVENWSLWLDMKILARTVGVVFVAGTGFVEKASCAVLGVVSCQGKPQSLDAAALIDCGRSQSNCNDCSHAELLVLRTDNSSLQLESTDS